MRRIRLRYLLREGSKSAFPDLYDAETGESLDLPIRGITVKDVMREARTATVEILLDQDAPVTPYPTT